MRKILILAVALTACAKSDTPPADTTTPAAVAPAPAATLAAADVQGTWNGTSMVENGDSVISHWNTIHDTDSTGRLAVQGSKDTVKYTVSFDADSMTTHSAPYKSAQTAKAPLVIFHAVGRLKDGKLVGTTALLLASKPDSVVARSRWEATKAP